MVTPVQASGTTSTPDSLVTKLVAEAGGASAATIHGVFKLEVTTEETTLDGMSHKGAFTAWVNPASWIQRRIEISPKVIIGFDGKTGWALINGTNDQRPQTPRQAAGTINRYLFAALLPFSLQAPNISLGTPRKGTWENDPAIQVPLSFPPNFFYTPMMDTQWILTLDTAKKTVLGVEFRPPEEYVSLGAEGMRYYILQRKTIDGVTLPTKLLAVAIDQQGNESGHVKTFTIKITRVDGGASLFLSPAALAAIGELNS